MKRPLEDSDDASGLGRQAAGGAVWMTAQKWLVRLTGLVTIGILTRTLNPEDFGVVAAAMTIVPIVYLISDLGFSAYIVQVIKTDQRMLSTGFWFSAGAGFILCAGMVAVAPLLAAVFQVPEVVPALRVMVVAVGMTAVGSVPIALLRRRMAFRSLAVQGACAALIGQGVAIAAAFMGAGVWALVSQLIAVQTITTLLAWWKGGWAPSWTFSREDFVSMSRFGTQVVTVDMVALGRNWAETAIIASTLGTTGLGYLNIAQRLVQVVQDLSAVALVPVSQVTFAKLREAPDRLRGAYSRAMSISYAVVAPLLVYVAVGAPLIVPLLFGANWEPSVQVAQALSIAAILTLGAQIDHGLFYGLGRPGSWLVYALAVDVTTVAVTAYTVQYGLVGVGLGFVAVALASTVVRWALVGQLIEQGVGTVSKSFWPLVVAGSLSALAGFQFLRFDLRISVLVTLTLLGMIIVGLQVVIVRLMAPAVLRDIVRLLRPERTRRYS